MPATATPSMNWANVDGGDMDYDFRSLGSRNFEHLAQAIAAKMVTRRLSVFGDGPDGGREATWEGEGASLGSAAQWNGYGVVQAKYQVLPASPAENLKWLKNAISAELSDWAKEGSNRIRKPDFLLFITNSKLSPSPQSGKDAANAHFRSKLKDLNLTLKDFRILDYDDLRTILDDSSDIRERYAAFISPSDLIASLIRKLEWEKKDFAEAMHSYVSRTLLEDDDLNLTQAGAAGEARISMSDVFIDLPFAIDPRGRTSPHSALGVHSELRGSDDVGVAVALVSEIDKISVSEAQLRADRFVLIGGPGQGKSTVTQWLAQVYRTRFLHQAGVGMGRQVTKALANVEKRHNDLGAMLPGGVRWPFRVALSDFADYLSKNSNHSLVHYIASRVSVRSSMEVTTGDIRQWIREMPTILIIDGLDEVPESSNREEVLKRINDFFIDVDTFGADVAAVATTRPQGYGDEFSPDDYHHVRLLPLEPEQAIAYAGSIVAIRSGVGTDQSEKVMRRLSDASQDEATLRFFETPLQVTILCILLEKVGKAPRDRSRLFSSYYEVIAQREQEKSGSLSQLLQRYESDVRDVHRAAGLRLQQRASGAGDTNATLTLQEFSDLLVQQFRTQGHAEDVIQGLSERFTQLITDRLVFLSVLRSDRIGFELRSLQEYMAAEQIVHRPEAEILPALTEIAETPYWRNVVLFAVGGIFADREHLRAEVVLLCQGLNVRSEEHKVTLPGSELALEILLDGSCDSMPRYSAPLAQIAAQLLDRPTNMLLTELGSLREEVVRSVIHDEARSTSPASLIVRGNRLLLLGLMADNGHRPSAEIIASQCAKLSDRDLRKLWPVLLEYAIMPILEVLEDRLPTANPQSIMEALAVYGGETEADGFPSLYTAMYEVSRYNLDSAHFIMEGVSHSIVQIGRAVDAWHRISETVGGDSQWDALRAVADFVVAPSGSALGFCLDALSVAEPFNAPVAMPWVITACLEDAAADGADAGERLRELAGMARRSELGDAADWLAAEELFSNPASINIEVVRRATESLEVTKSVSALPALAPDSSPSPLSWVVAVSLTPGATGEAGEMLAGLMALERTTQNFRVRFWLRGLVLTVASMAFSRYYRISDREALTHEASIFVDWLMGRREVLDERELQAFVDAASLLPWDPRWEGRLDSDSAVATLNARRGRVPDGLVQAARAGGGGGLVRLIAAFGALVLANDEIVGEVHQRLIADAAGGSSLAVALDIYRRRKNPWSQDLDEPFAKLAASSDHLGLLWLRSVAMDKTSEVQRLCVRIAHELADWQPQLADQFFTFSLESRPNTLR